MGGICHLSRALSWQCCTTSPANCAMTVLLLCTDSRCHAGVQDVAIKMVFHTDQEAREKFETEIAMLKFVSRDRNIVQFYGAGVRMSDPHAQGKVEARLWLITEYMEVRCWA